MFGIDIETCEACGGAVRIIACIEDPAVIEKILAHLNAKAGEPEAPLRPPCRAPLQQGLFDETGSKSRYDLVWAAASAARQWRCSSRKPAGEGGVCRRGRRWDEFRAVPPICTLMGQPTADARADQARLNAASHRKGGQCFLYLLICTHI